MNELTEKEIDFISLEIDQEGLTYTLLKNELLDHVCCQIEEEMESGITFNEAFQRVKQKMGSRRIRKIQDETMYLINKKYRRMKKLMYGLGIAVPILMIVGLIFKMQHWPGASILVSLGLFSAAAFFLPVFVMVRIRDTRAQNEIVPMGLYLSGMIGGILSVIGSLLKIQHMPGASVFLSLGLITLALVFLPMFALNRVKAAREKSEQVNTGLYIVGVIAGILFFTGALFKLMHWQGAGMVITISWLLVAIVLLPVMVLYILKQKENKVNNFFIVVLVLSLLSILILSQVRKTGMEHTNSNINLSTESMESTEPLESL